MFCEPPLATLRVLSAFALPATRPAAVAEPEPVAVIQSGPQVYNAACNVCHGNGVAGAPITGDADAWAARIAQGNEILYRHAIESFAGEAGYMPAKGGNVSLSDEEVIAAVDYMVEESR